MAKLSLSLLFSRQVRNRSVPTLFCVHRLQNAGCKPVDCHIEPVHSISINIEQFANPNSNSGIQLLLLYWMSLFSGGTSNCLE
jgi:hypothetical protein